MIELGLVVYLMIGVLVAEVNARYFAGEKGSVPLFNLCVVVLWPIVAGAIAIDFCRFVWSMFWGRDD